MNNAPLRGLRVLVTGGAGFIGLEVCAGLAERGHTVRVVDSLRSDVHPDATSASAKVTPYGELTIGDIRDDAVLDRCLAGIDVVIHLAAKVGLGVGIADLPDYASSNDYGTACLVAAMARSDIHRLVLASSMVVYGEGVGRCREHGEQRPAVRPDAWLAAGRYEPPCPVCGTELEPALVPETTAVDPRNAYAASKLAQENLATTWARGTEGALTVLRYHNVYGPGLPISTPYAGVAALWLTELRAGRAPRVFEDGRQRRDFIHVSDIANATIAAAVATSSPSVRTYNVGSGRVQTVGGMATALADAFGGPAPIVTGDYRLGDVRHITADSTRLRRDFDLPPQVGLHEGLAGLIKA